jgi:hypothetical protein
MKLAGLVLCISLQNIMKILYPIQKLVSSMPVVHVTYTKFYKFNVTEIFEIWLKFMKNLSKKQLAIMLGRFGCISEPENKHFSIYIKYSHVSQCNVQLYITNCTKNVYEVIEYLTS